ncbi:hypothetical protein F5B19DRAFT_466187 [Rostrohypoxylon terebratum]|nr:hypothetical protein F5B19DRAFT_466187 [Rostrohypoxylon terebratum]
MLYVHVRIPLCMYVVFIALRGAIIRWSLFVRSSSLHRCSVFRLGGFSPFEFVCCLVCPLMTCGIWYEEKKRARKRMRVEVSL